MHLIVLKCNIGINQNISRNHIRLLILAYIAHGGNTTCFIHDIILYVNI